MENDIDFVGLFLGVAEVDYTNADIIIKFSLFAQDRQRESIVDINHVCFGTMVAIPKIDMERIKGYQERRIAPEVFHRKNTARVH